MSPFKGPLKTNAKEPAMKFLQLLLILLLFPFNLYSQNGNWEELGPNGWNNIQSWSPGVGRVNCFAVDPNDSDIILAGTYSGVWKTVDGGINWSPLNEQKKYKNIQTIAIDPSNSDTYYIGYVFDNPEAIYSRSIPDQTAAKAIIEGYR